jgi:hypothetical protein
MRSYLMAHADLFAFSCHPYNRNRDVVCGLPGKRYDALDAMVTTILSRSFAWMSLFKSSGLNFKRGMLQREIGR